MVNPLILPAVVFAEMANDYNLAVATQRQLADADKLCSSPPTKIMGPMKKMSLGVLVAINGETK